MTVGAIGKIHVLLEKSFSLDPGDLSVISCQRGNVKLKTNSHLHQIFAVPDFKETTSFRVGKKRTVTG